ncbi:MAG: DUF488 domain-containing protein [Hyphomicrobiaceae bacterium]|nr:DUF488 domain-containing protein [Hyphomicrobiaceae bacterium]
MQHPFHTIGHSNRTIQLFIGLLRASAIDLVADVRTVPRSRKNPQFNSNELPGPLADCQISYRHLPALGGLRHRSKETPASTNSFWKNESFHNYADYAMTESYRLGLAELRTLGHARRTAIMCSEAVWWRCHRRIIADYLIAAGEQVFHILGENAVHPATMTASARPQPDGTIVYPPE